MKLSIISVCFNNIEGLKRTYRSVVEQTSRKDFEWVIIDGASTDGTAEWLLDHDSEIDRWISEPDTGIYNAMNKGVRLASGDYLLFLNSGDTLNETEIIAGCLAYMSDKKSDLLFGDQIVYDPKNDNYGLWQTPFPIRPCDFITRTLPHQSTFIKKELLLQIPYRENIGFAADWLFFIEILLRLNIKQTKIAEHISIFFLDGVSNNDSISNVERRKATFIKCFSESLWNDLFELQELHRLPALGLNKSMKQIRFFIGNIFRKFHLR